MVFFMKVIHIATLHRRHDTRILLKECVSLSEAGFDVFLIVGDGEGDEIYEGIQIIDVGRPDGRFASRLLPMLRTVRQVRELAPDLVHFHDGMFLPIAIFLAFCGWRVIYDVHEDYRQQVLRLRFPWLVRRGASVGYILLEWIGGRIFTRIVAATPYIATHFPKHKTITVQNFPLQEELVIHSHKLFSSRSRFAFVGGISKYRGIREMVAAMEILDQGGVVLELAGSFSPETLHREMESQQGWSRVRFRNWLSRDDVATLLADSRAGLVLFHPLPNNMKGQPNKLFEYMSAGLPVIASDFPLWRRIVMGANCGLLVDPLDVNAIAEAMAWILDHPEEAEEMGRRGQKAVLETYNWAIEEKKLIECYRSLEVPSP